MENIGLDRLLKFGARERLLQNFGEHLAERGVFGRAGLLARLVLAVEQTDVDRLANQIEQIFARKFDEARAEKNVIMDVVDPDGQIGEPDFGGVRLKLHPGGMD